MHRPYPRPMLARNIFIVGLFLYPILLWLAVAECGVAEEPPAAPAPVPVIPGPPPPPQEQILSPIPKQFDWMQREVRPNPLLQSLLGLREVTRGLFMSVSLSEEYSDNFFRTERNPQEEYRTSLNIGTVYRMERGPSFIALANSISANYAARSEVSNFGFANLSLNAGHRLPRLSLALSESFIRSDEAEEASLTGIRRERRRFLQNIVSPQVRYEFTPVTAANFAYTNRLVINQGREQGDIDTSPQDDGLGRGDSISHSFTTGLQHQLTRAFLGRLGYTFTTTDSDQSGDTREHFASADLGYIFDARTSTTFRIFGNLIDRTGGGTNQTVGEADVNVYGANIGVRRQLTSFLGAFVAVGPTLVDRQDRAKRVFANWQASLDGSLPITRRTTLTFSTVQNIDDTAGDIDDVGLVLSREATLTLSHALSRDLSGSIFVNYTRTEPLENIGTAESLQDREFTFWSTGATMSYALTRLWSLTANYRYQRRDSPVSSGDPDGTRLGGNYAENRFTISVSAAFPVF